MPLLLIQKTPIAISLKYMYNLKLKDLLMLEKDKNIPGAIRETAKSSDKEADIRAGYYF